MRNSLHTHANCKRHNLYSVLCHLLSGTHDANERFRCTAVYGFKDNLERNTGPVPIVPSKSRPKCSELNPRCLCARATIVAIYFLKEFFSSLARDGAGKPKLSNQAPGWREYG
jgi:hypothetical protein